MSKKYSLNKRQIYKGLIMSAIFAIIPIISGVISAPDFDIRTIFTFNLLNDIIKASLNGIIYYIYSYFEDKK